MVAALILLLLFLRFLVLAFGRRIVILSGRRGKGSITIRLNHAGSPEICSPFSQLHVLESSMGFAEMATPGLI